MNKFRQQSKFTPTCKEDKQISKNSYYHSCAFKLCTTKKDLNNNGKLFSSSLEFFHSIIKSMLRKTEEDEGKNSS